MPDSMVFVLALTVIVFLMALGLTSSSALDLVNDYGNSFWLLLTFSMQLSILMVTGFVVADSRPVKAGLIWLLSIPKTAKGTMVLFCVVVGIVSWFHWGIGSMVAMIMGRELAVRKRGLGIHYPFICATSYGVVNIMCNGPSQSAPLLIATPGHFMEKTIGLVPLTTTALSPFLLTLMLVFFVTVPIVVILIMPSKDRAVEIDDDRYNEFTATLPKDPEKKSMRHAERWDRSWVLQSTLGGVMFVWVCYTIYHKGLGRLDMNSLNFFFLTLSMILHGTPHAFMESVKRAVSVAYGIMIQFPMYAGIFGMINQSGLAAVITHWFVSFSTPGTYSWIVYLYTGIMDFFVPSGGSKFVIEAPYLIPAGKELGIPVPHIINAYSTGAQWANLIQPFWALPMLAAFRLRFQDILPFTFIYWLFAFVVSTAAFLLFPHGF